MEYIGTIDPGGGHKKKPYGNRNSIIPPIRADSFTLAMLLRHNSICKEGKLLLRLVQLYDIYIKTIFCIMIAYVNSCLMFITIVYILNYMVGLITFERTFLRVGGTDFDDFECVR